VTCLRATGDAGELVRLRPITKASSAVDVLHVGDAGPEQVQRIAIGRVLDCPAVAAADRAGVIAGPVRVAKHTAEMRASLREPGGGFGAPVRIGSTTMQVGQPAAAIAPSGAAVVVWAQRKTTFEERPFEVDRSRLRIMAVQRAAGAGFGPPQALTPWRPGGVFPEAQVAAAIDPAGRAVVAWSRSVRKPRRALSRSRSRPASACTPPIPYASACTATRRATCA
jgi:hypothetical protein